jgi:hypothetical protein
MLRWQRSARVSRANASPARTFGVAPKQAYLKARSLAVAALQGKFATARTRSPARQRRALPRNCQQDRERLFDIFGNVELCRALDVCQSRRGPTR